MVQSKATIRAPLARDLGALYNLMFQNIPKAQRTHMAQTFTSTRGSEFTNPTSFFTGEAEPPGQSVAVLAAFFQDTLSGAVLKGNQRQALRSFAGTPGLDRGLWSGTTTCS